MYIVIMKGTITVDASTLGLEFISKSACEIQIGWQGKGGFDISSYEIMTIRAVKEIYMANRLKNYAFTERAWNKFIGEILAC